MIETKNQNQNDFVQLHRSFNYVAQIKRNEIHRNYVQL